MRAAVRKSFTKFTEPFEGIVLSFYCCVKSLPTFGLGNMVPSAQAAALHPFCRPDGTLATAAEKSREWHYTKNGACGAVSTKDDPNGHQRCRWPHKASPATGLGCFAHRGWKVAAAALGQLNGFGAPLRVTRAYVDALTEKELTRFWGILRTYFPDIDAWPAPAQLGLLSMAWGLGPAFSPKWPKFTAAAKRRDFYTCAVECVIRNSARNGVNADLFLAAARVDELGADLDTLWMRPDDVVPPTIVVEDRAPDAESTTEVVAAEPETKDLQKDLGVNVLSQPAEPASSFAAFFAWLFGWVVSRFGRL
jgi:hypothetical protein